MKIVIDGSREELERLLLREVSTVVARRPAGMVGFATGGTYAGLFDLLAGAVHAGTVRVEELRGTHLDEYLGYGPADVGGMVHELVSSCPPLGDMLDAGRFWPVPSTGDSESMQAHEQRLVEVGHVDLQFLGIGRNGHIGFNEPGTPFDLGFHRTTLADTTRADARGRFAPDDPPREAVTAGPRTILRARRLVLAAFGRAKAAAVQAMIEGPVDPRCPASCLRRHADVAVYLDTEAASMLQREVEADAR